MCQTRRDYGEGIRALYCELVVAIIPWACDATCEAIATMNKHNGFVEMGLEFRFGLCFGCG